MGSPRWTSGGGFYKDGMLRGTARAFLQEILLEQVVHERGSDCWWFPLGTTNHGGYKSFEWNRKKILAHRFAYELFKGEIPNGMYVLHSCDTPPCVNPEHLRIGTNADNNRDRVEHGRQGTNGWEKRTHCPQGHEYTLENTYLFENRRYCRACHHRYSLNYARTHTERKAKYLREWRRRHKELTTPNQLQDSPA